MWYDSKFEFFSCFADITQNGFNLENSYKTIFFLNFSKFGIYFNEFLKINQQLLVGYNL